MDPQSSPPPTPIANTEHSPVSQQPPVSPPANPHSRKKLMVYGFIAVIGLIALLVGVYSLGVQKSPKNVIPATPTPVKKAAEIDPTADWKTYVDSELFYSVKYPTSARINKKDSYTDIIIRDGADFSVGDSINLRIEVIENPKNYSLDEVHKQSIGYACGTELGGTCTTKTLNGYSALKTTGYINVSEISAYYIAQKNKVYRLSWSPGQENDDTRGDQILSTFKFTQ